MEQLQKRVLFDRFITKTKISNNRQREVTDLFPLFIVTEVPNDMVDIYSKNTEKKLEERNECTSLFQGILKNNTPLQKKEIHIPNYSIG